MSVDSLSDEAIEMLRRHKVKDASIEFHTLRFEIKTLGNGRVGGYVIRWGNPDLTDQTSKRDFFTPKTNLGRLASGPLDVFYYHGLKSEADALVIGEARLKPDDKGVAIDAQLDMSIKAARDTYQAVASGDCAGWSSGAVGHLVRRKQVLNSRGEKVSELVNWPIFECSLTETPGEARTSASVIESKTLGQDRIDRILARCDRISAEMRSQKDQRRRDILDRAVSAVDRLSKITRR